MSRWQKLSVSVLLFLVLACACQLASAVPAETSIPTQPAFQAQTIAPETATNLPSQETATMTPPMNEVPIPTPLDPGMEKLVTQAKDDLARRLSLDAGQIELLEASEVTWPDGSLGCPQPGMLYTQVMVDGLRIRLRAGGKEYAYHSGGSRPLFLCENQ